MDAEGILQAFEIGSERIKVSGQAPTTRAAERHLQNTAVFSMTGDGSAPTSIPLNAAVQVDARIMLRPGQYIGQKGTAIYNPLRSSPEVEAILGEKIYNPARVDNETEKLKLAFAEKEDKIAELSTQLKQLTEIVAIQSQRSASGKRRNTRTRSPKKENENGETIS